MGCTVSNASHIGNSRFSSANLSNSLSGIECDSVRLPVVAAISVDDFGRAKRSTARAANRRNRVNQRQQLSDVVAVCARQGHADRHPVGIYEDVMFGTRSRAIRGVRPSFSPAPTARTDDESTAAYERRSPLARLATRPDRDGRAQIERRAATPAAASRRRSADPRLRAIEPESAARRARARHHGHGRVHAQCAMSSIACPKNASRKPQRS